MLSGAPPSPIVNGLRCSLDYCITKAREDCNILLHIGGFLLHIGGFLLHDWHAISSNNKTKFLPQNCYVYILSNLFYISVTYLSLELKQKITVFVIFFQGQNQSGGPGGRGDGKKDDKVKK